MIIKIGDMWNGFADGNSLWLFTGNGYTDKYNRLVMGKGLAAQVKKRFPWSPQFLGNLMIEQYGDCGFYGHPAVYGLLTCGVMKEQRIGVVQVKRHFKDPADLCLIGYSLTMLKNWMKRNDRVYVNYPGIGNGQRTEAEVLPLLQEFDDRLTVWKLPPP